MGFANYSKVQSFEDMAEQQEQQEAVAETNATEEAKADNTEDTKAE